MFDALTREVAKAPGLEVSPGGLLNVWESMESVRARGVELTFVAESNGLPTLNSFKAVDLAGGERPLLRPPILDHIVLDMASGWRETRGGLRT